jgi:hypothetical protein
MKKVWSAMLLLASATLFAQGPFDGTWMTKLDTAKLPTKPDKSVEQLRATVLAAGGRVEGIAPPGTIARRFNHRRNFVTVRCI